MTLIQSVKGMPDLLPGDIGARRFVERAAAEQFARAGIQEIRTPLLEPLELFVHSVGETSDIVRKEMYTLVDQGGRQLALRPEGTAAVVRAVLQHGLLGQGEEVRLWYTGAMFRQENTQKGRLRQFQQIGVEVFGAASPWLDAELIALNVSFLKYCRVATLPVQLNSLGDQESRASYRGLLLEFLQKNRQAVCDDCKARTATNPLRVLDCKLAACQALYATGPVPSDTLSDLSRQRFDEVQQTLVNLNVEFELNPRLVRGLDYYTDTVFEIPAAGLGAQNTVSAGGRYDGLVSAFGGPETPAFGFAAGVERMLLAATGLPAEGTATTVAWIALDDVARREGVTWVHQLRERQIAAIQFTHKGSVKAQMRAANSAGAGFALIRGNDDRQRGEVVLKNLASGEQSAIRADLDAVAAALAKV